MESQKTTVEQLAEQVVADMDVLSNSERADVIDRILDTYCKYCGLKKSEQECWCWNNE